MPSLSKAFRAFNAKGRNTRWSWSARTPDGRVVMTLWQDRFVSGQPLTYSNLGSPTLDQWRDKPGNHERLENLKWARDNWGGLMGVVIIRATDVAEVPRSIADAFPRTDLLMKLQDLNDATGEFSAVNVGKWADWKPRSD